MEKRLKYLLLAVLAFMIYVVISTSLQSNLFNELGNLISIPWMKATLWDFYANVLLIFIWVIYKETKTWKAILWGTIFFFLGSIGTITYVLIQIVQLKSGESIKELLIKKNN